MAGAQALNKRIRAKAGNKNRQQAKTFFIVIFSFRQNQGGFPRLDGCGDPLTDFNH
ncbi:MAG: hypothetical protein WA110_00165 [Anaerolineaceae bacterium]